MGGGRDGGARAGTRDHIPVSISVNVYMYNRFPLYNENRRPPPVSSTYLYSCVRGYESSEDYNDMWSMMRRINLATKNAPVIRMSLGKSGI